MDLSRFDAAPSVRLSHFPFESDHHDLHAMRFRGVIEQAWAGCDDDEIIRYSGHKI